MFLKGYLKTKGLKRFDFKQNSARIGGAFSIDNFPEIPSEPDDRR